MASMTKAILTIAVLLIVVSSAGAQTLWNGILAPARATDWTYAGVQGGIPDAGWPVYATESPVGTIGSPVAPTTINADIVSACAAHPSGSVIVLGAGNYYLSSGIWLKCNNIAIRGAGANSTFLFFSAGVGCWVNNATADICAWNNSTVYSGGWSGAGTLSGTLSQGTTSITLTTSYALSGSTPVGLVVGAPIILDACNTGVSGASSYPSTSGCSTGTQTDNGNLFFCDVQWTGSVGCNGSTPTGNYRANRAQEEVHTISSISCTGTGPYVCTIGIEGNGLMLPNWGSVSNPEAWWSDTASKGIGIENLSIDNGITLSPGAPETIAFSWVSNGWVTGVRSLLGHRINVDIFMSNHITVENNYFYGVSNPGTTSYALSPDDSSYVLACNNIFQHITAPMAADGPDAGSVYCDSYSTDDAYNSSGGTQFQASEEPHSAGDVMELFEGYQGVGFNADDVHGTEDMQTLYRDNYSAEGVTGNINSGPPNPVQFAAYQRYGNIVNSVLGFNTTQTGTYQVNTSGSCSSQPGLGSGNPIYFLGCMGNEFGPYDSGTGTTLMRWGNYDVVNAAVLECTAASTPIAACSANERGNGASTYPGLTSPSTTFPASFVFSSQPSFWTVCTNYPTCSTTYTPPWPNIGGDITGGSGPGGHVYENPAKKAFETLPNDTSYESTYTVTGASCSGGKATLTVSIPTGNYPSGWISVASVNPSGYNGTWNMTGVSSSGNLSSASYYVASCPGSYVSGGTVTYPLIKTFNGNIYTGTPQASTPSCTPTSGVPTLSVTCSLGASGSVMCYSTSTTPATNGTTGCTTGTLYSTAISITVNPTTLKVIAGGTGYTDSNVVTYTYSSSINVTAPCPACFVSAPAPPTDVTAEIVDLP